MLLPDQSVFFQQWPLPVKVPHQPNAFLPFLTLWEQELMIRHLQSRCDNAVSIKKPVWKALCGLHANRAVALCRQHADGIPSDVE